MQTVGSRLRQRREARGLSLDAVTRATRLTRTVLLALEEDRFHDLAAPVYVRGFLRLYARHLELDADGALEGYEQQIAVGGDEGQVRPVAHLPDYLRGDGRGARSVSPAQAFLLTATAVILAIFMWQVSRKRQVPLAQRPTSAVVAPATASGPLVPAPIEIKGNAPAPRARSGR